MAGRLDLVPPVEGGAEPVALTLPCGGVGREVEEGAQEVLRAGVLVEAAREIGDGGIAVGLLDDGRVEQERTGLVTHRPCLRGGHALEHFDLDHGRILERVAQGQRPGDVEEVVRGNTEPDGSRVCLGDGLLQHRLVGGVDVSLGVVRRLRPVVHLGLDLLHREVGAFDEADLDRRAAEGMTRIGPGDESLEGLVRVGDVGLQHDSRAHVVELRLVEHGDEGLHREVEVAVFLHVEVDEGAVGPGDPVERREPLGDAGHGVVPGQDVEVGAQRRDLDRHVGHVGAAYARGNELEARVGLVVAEDRFAQHVDVEVEALAAPLGEIATEWCALARQDDAGRLTVDTPVDTALGEQGSVGRDAPDHAKAHAIDESERTRHAALDEVAQSSRGPLAIADAQHLVGEIEEQVAPGIVSEEAAERARSTALLERGAGEGGAEQASGARLGRGRQGLGRL